MSFNGEPLVHRYVYEFYWVQDPWWTSDFGGDEKVYQLLLRWLMVHDYRIMCLMI